MNPKMKMARQGALSKLMSLLDEGDAGEMRKPFGDAGDKNPFEKSGYEGEVSPAKYFSAGGMIDEEREGPMEATVGSGNHDETSPEMFASAWEQLTGKKYRHRQDQMGLGGESSDDGSGVDAASEGDDEDDKPLGKR